MFVKRALVMAHVSIFVTTAALSQSRSLQQGQSPVRMMPSAFAALTSLIMRKFTPAC
jgi:hypothetical protein